MTAHYSQSHGGVCMWFPQCPFCGKSFVPEKDHVCQPRNVPEHMLDGLESATDPKNKETIS